MDIKAIRGSFGDFGRVRKGQIVKGVDKKLAEKLLTSGAYAEATPKDIKDATNRTELGILHANEIAKAAKSEAADIDALLAEIEAGEKALTASKAETETAVRELATYKSEAEGKLAEIVKASEGVTAEFAAYKTEADAKLITASDEIADLKAKISDLQQAASQSEKTDADKSKGKS
uniref:Uncharacterized protein n=1 Tax=biofilter metagenome TaxID=1070537 RepID=A0A1A7GD44_9ZZZZ